MGTIAILGGGHGGFAAAVHLQLKGHCPILWSKQPRTLEKIRARGGLGYAGVLGDGFVPVEVADDIGRAVRHADVVMVCAPTTVHRLFAEALAPVLPDSACVFLNPGHTCGGLQFLHCLRRAGFSKGLLLGEGNTLTYACRKVGETDVAIYHQMRNVLVGSLPGDHIEEFVSAITPYYPDVVPCPTTLEPSLANMNAVIHPVGMILSAAWIEHTQGDFFFYADAATQSVARSMDAVDGERLSIARGWGLPAQPDLPTLLARHGFAPPEAAQCGASLEALLASPALKRIRAPDSLDHRYIYEDVPFGLVPLAELAGAVGVDVPVIRGIITLASICNGADYGKSGLTLGALGLDDCSRDEIWRRLTTG
jgi:opine dehydrogenase